MTTLLHTFCPWALGAPLYMPAHRRDIIDCANGDKLPHLRSVIFCTEDAILATELESSLRHLALCLQGFKTVAGRYRFIRVRNPDVLAYLLDLPQIDQIDGFVLPKFDLNNLEAYLGLLQGSHFKLMPTLETAAVFDRGAMRELCQALLQHSLRDQIIMLRIGGNDLLSLLGLRRQRSTTLYDGPLGPVISQLVTIFKPHGFRLAAPVFDDLEDTLTLKREIDLDLLHGLTGKTAIHPSQIATIESAYKVNQQDYDTASQLLNQAAPAVFKMYNTMCEIATHRNWAHDILTREQCFGTYQPTLETGMVSYAG
jgi:citrate lyase beta subunit